MRSRVVLEKKAVDECIKNGILANILRKNHAEMSEEANAEECASARKGPYKDKSLVYRIKIKYKGKIAQNLQENSGLFSMPKNKFKKRYHNFVLLSISLHLQMTG